MLLLMAGLAAVTAAAARSASSLRETVLLGTTAATCAATSTSHANMCGAIEFEHDDDDDDVTLLPLSKPTAQHMPSISKPTNPTNTRNDGQQLIALQLSTMLISNAITRRQEHAENLAMLASQHAAHQTEVLRLRRDMEVTASNLQGQLDDLRTMVETMQQQQKEEDTKKQQQKPSVRECVITSSAHLRDHLQRMLADLSNTRTEQEVGVSLLIIIVAHLLQRLTRKCRSKRTRTKHDVSNCRYHHPTSPTSTSTYIPNLSTADSCSSPSLGSIMDHDQISPSTPCPPYIAIPAVQRRMTTAMTIEQMARDADVQYPHAKSHLPLPPPPLIPSLCQEETTGKPSLDACKTKSESVLKRKARILSRRLRSMARKVQTSPADRFFIRMSFLVLLATVITKTVYPAWTTNEFVPLADLPQPLGLLIELVITFFVFLAAGYRLSFGPSNESTRDAARAANKRSTIRRHRSLIRGPSTVRSSTSSNSRSTVFRRQRRPSKISLVSRSRLE